MQMVDNNFGKFRVMTFAGTKDKSFEDAGWKQVGILQRKSIPNLKKEEEERLL